MYKSCGIFTFVTILMFIDPLWKKQVKMSTRMLNKFEAILINYIFE